MRILSGWSKMPEFLQGLEDLRERLGTIQVGEIITLPHHTVFGMEAQETICIQDQMLVTVHTRVLVVILVCI